LRGTSQRHSQQHVRITQILVVPVEGMFESLFWKMIGEPRGGYSKLRNQALRKHGLPGEGAGKGNLKETLLSQSKGVLLTGLQL